MDEDGLWFGDIEAENDDWFMMDALSPSRAPSLSIEREREGREGREREGETEGGERGWRDLFGFGFGGGEMEILFANCFLVAKVFFC